MMRRILVLLTVVAMMVAMMGVMAGTASAQATFSFSCLIVSNAEREELGTIVLLPTGTHPFQCTGKPFTPS